MLSYIKTDSTKEQVVFQNNVTEIDLSISALVDIDLSPPFCYSLQIIGLGEFPYAALIE